MDPGSGSRAQIDTEVIESNGSELSSSGQPFEAIKIKGCTPKNLRISCPRYQGLFFFF
jgi:hypothetical protein